MKKTNLGISSFWYDLVVVFSLLSLCVLFGFGLNAFENSVWNQAKQMNAEGKRLFEEKQYLEAAEVYTRVLELDSDNTIAEEGLSDVHMEIARITEDESMEIAIEEYQTAIDYDESNLTAYQELASLYFKQQKVENAMNTLKKMNQQYSRIFTGEYITNRILRLTW